MGKFKVKLARILDRMRPHLKQVKNEEKIGINTLNNVNKIYL